MRVSCFVLKIILCLKSQLRLDVGGEMPALKPSCKTLVLSAICIFPTLSSSIFIGRKHFWFCYHFSPIVIKSIISFLQKFVTHLYKAFQVKCFELKSMCERKLRKCTIGLTHFRVESCYMCVVCMLVVKVCICLCFDMTNV
jgi:hypothetical protein